MNRFWWRFFNWCISIGRVRLTFLGTLLALVLGAIFVMILNPRPASLNPFSAAFWFTPDQLGDQLMRRGAFAKAAQSYDDPLRKGIAFYRAGDFKAAARTFSPIDTPEGQFNRGNSLVMQGQYTAAVTAYNEALALRPDWAAAKTNRKIASLRAEKLKQEGGNMTEGKLTADEIVFTADKQNGADQEQNELGGEPLSDQALQALWLRRIQTKPVDFLKAKFAYQLSLEDDK